MSLQAACEAEVLRVWQGQADGAHDLAHLRRVWRLVQEIVEELRQGDLRILEAASFLHDIINPPKDSPDRSRASQMSAAHAARFLASKSWADEDIRNVAHAIEAHSFSAGILPRTVEAEILRDADRLEALGALGVARCFNVSGQLGIALFDPADPLAQKRELNDRAYALDHFETKLFRIADNLNTAAAKRIAAKRVAFMELFREQLLREIE